MKTFAYFIFSATNEKSFVYFLLTNFKSHKDSKKKSIPYVKTPSTGNFLTCESNWPDMGKYTVKTNIPLMTRLNEEYGNHMLGSSILGSWYPAALKIGLISAKWLHKHELCHFKRKRTLFTFFTTICNCWIKIHELFGKSLKEKKLFTPCGDFYYDKTKHQQ